MSVIFLSNSNLMKYADSIAATPKLEPNSFFVTVFCKDFDAVDLVDHKKFVDFFHQTTDRNDVHFKKIVALTYWK